MKFKATRNTKDIRIKDTVLWDHDWMVKSSQNWCDKVRSPFGEVLTTAQCETTRASILLGNKTLIVPVNYTLEVSLILRKSILSKLKLSKQFQRQNFFLQYIFFFIGRFSVGSLVHFVNISLPITIQGTEMSIRYRNVFLWNETYGMFSVFGWSFPWNFSCGYKKSSLGQNVDHMGPLQCGQSFTPRIRAQGKAEFPILW